MAPASLDGGGIALGRRAAPPPPSPSPPPPPPLLPGAAATAIRVVAGNARHSESGADPPKREETEVGAANAFVGLLVAGVGLLVLLALVWCVWQRHRSRFAMRRGQGGGGGGGGGNQKQTAHVQRFGW